MSADNIPEFHESSIPSVGLLQGVVYSEDEKVWAPLLSHRMRIESYFARLGLKLVIDEAEGFAYLKQMGEDDERPTGYEKLSILIPRKSLGYGLTILSVLLREHLRRFDEEELHDERCVVETTILLDEWRGFQKPANDESKQLREFTALMRRADEEFGFIRKYAEDPESWEIRRIIKARLPVSELESLRGQLETYSSKALTKASITAQDDG